jgi:hypothetical protein
LIDGRDGIGNRLACLDLIPSGKHALDDPAECEVVIYHQDATHLDLAGRLFEWMVGA